MLWSTRLYWQTTGLQHIRCKEIDGHFNTSDVKRQVLQHIRFNKIDGRFTTLGVIPTVFIRIFLCVHCFPKLVVQKQVVITQKVVILQHYDIYHKMQYMFKFYLLIFTGVQCGFIVSRGRCPICRRFRPKSHESYPYLWSQPLLLSVSVVLPNLQDEVDQNLCP